MIALPRRDILMPWRRSKATPRRIGNRKPWKLSNSLWPLDHPAGPGIGDNAVGGRRTMLMPSLDLSCMSCCGGCCSGRTLPDTLFATFEDYDELCAADPIPSFSIDAIDLSPCTYGWTGSTPGFTIGCNGVLQRASAFLSCCPSSTPDVFEFAATAGLCNDNTGVISATLISCDPFEFFAELFTDNACCKNDGGGCNSDSGSIFHYNVRFTE
jgi:hypothetical protein